MWFAEPWRRKMGPEKLLVLGGGAALLRWTAYAFAPPLWLLFPLQALHALTFAASFMASLRLIERLAPPQSASAAQAINSALSAGFMLGVGTLASGPLFDAFGTRGYLAMAVEHQAKSPPKAERVVARSPRQQAVQAVEHCPRLRTAEINA